MKLVVKQTCILSLYVVAVVVGVACLILLGGICICFGYYYYKSKREYKTYEGEDSRYFDSADIALAAAADRQPEVQKDKEYYI